MQLSRTQLIRFFLGVSLVLFPFGNLFRFQISQTVSLLPLDCTVFLLALCSIPEILENLKKSPVLKGILGFYSFGIVGLLISSTWLHPASLLVSALYGIRFVSYSVLLWMCSQLSNDEKEKLKTGLMYSGATMAGFGILQYAFFPDLRGLFFLGWDEHYFRLFGTLLDPNYSGAVFVISTFLALDQLYAKKSSIWLVILPLFAVFLTYSRSSFLMLIVAVTVYYGLKGMYKHILLGLLTIMLGIFLIPKNIRSEGVELLRTASIYSRITEYTQAVDVFKANPIFGVGFNAYRYAQLKHGFIDDSFIIPDHSGAGVPNSFLFLLATTGIGSVAFIGGIGFLLRQAYKQKNFLIVSSIMAICTHAFFENTLFYPFVMFQYMILLGVQDIKR